MISNSIDIFIDSLILLIQANRANNTTSIEIVQQMLSQYHEDIRNRDGIDDGVSRSFVSLLEELMSVKNGFTEVGILEKKTIILRFLNNKEISKDKYLSDLIRRLLDEDIKDLDYDTTHLERRLNNGLLFKKVSKLTRKIFGQLNQCSNTTDVDKQDLFLQEIRSTAGAIELSFRNSGISTNKAVESINFSDKESLKKALSKFKDKKSQILKTGLKGLNRMLGSNGGFSCGETCMVYALTHHFKSGLMMTIARGLVKYNTPTFDPKLGTPLILFITLENEANKNFMSMYKQAYEQTYQRSSKGLSDEEIIEFVHDFFSSGGYTFMMERWDGTSFGIEELEGRIDDLRLQGFNIVAVLMDYMQLMKQSSKSGDNKNLATHTQLSTLTYTLCAKFKNENTLFITPHQLEGEASKLASSGIQNVVKKFGSHNVSGSKEISRHVDFEVFIHLETNHMGRRFVTMQRGKHRSTEDDTPVAHRYCAYPFTKFGIVDDIESDGIGYVTDIYGEEAERITDDQLEQEVKSQQVDLFEISNHVGNSDIF